jgi:twitching motility protein PilT
MLDSMIKLAKLKNASDLHLESGLPMVLRIDGALKVQGDPIRATTLQTIARKMIGEPNWPQFLERGSYDLSVNIANIRCRINVLRTIRGIGLAIRILSAFQPTLEKLNLNPDLRQILHHSHGLVLVSGPTGCGKSSTMAALIQEINLKHAAHIITIENPVEYHFKIQRSFIRQREVGRDTTSFSQGLIDAMREDPDVLMVGEMREQEVMRQTLNAAETGHLVFATMHSGSVVEALQRIVASFPAEFQNGVRAKLADSVLAVICQRLIFLPDLNIRVPECEIMFNNLTVKSVIRDGKFFKLNDVIQTSAAEKMWSLDRYRQWIDERTDWYLGGTFEPDPSVDMAHALNEFNFSKKSDSVEVPMEPLLEKHKPVTSAPVEQKTKDFPYHPKKLETDEKESGYYEIGDESNDSVEDILKELNAMKKPKK